MQIAAPSFWPLLLPAVTVASGSAGAHDRPQPAERLERGVGARDARRRRPRHRRPGTATISSAKQPLRWAATARSCERRASSSCSSLAIPYCRRRFSAVSSIPPGTGWLTPPGVHPGAFQPILKPGASAPDAPAQSSSSRARPGSCCRRRPPGRGRRRRVCTCMQPYSTAWSAEPQRRSICSPGTSHRAAPRRAPPPGRSPAPRRWHSTGP